jgi:hypothetical protein
MAVKLVGKEAFQVAHMGSAMYLKTATSFPSTVHQNLVLGQRVGLAGQQEVHWTFDDMYGMFHLSGAPAH